jgi:hypothetical protein
MDIAVMAAAVLAVVQIVKKWPFLAKISPVILSAFASIGVVAYYAVKTGTPITAALIWVAIQVFVYANGGYKLLKVASGTTTG